VDFTTSYNIFFVFRFRKAQIYLSHSLHFKFKFPILFASIHPLSEARNYHN